MEGDLEFLQPSHRAGSCFRFFVNCPLFPLLCPEVIPEQQEVTNPDCSQGHRDQIVLVHIGVHFQSPCPSHTPLHFNCSWKDVGSWQEWVTLNHLFPKELSLPPFQGFLGCPWQSCQMETAPH